MTRKQKLKRKAQDQGVLGQFDNAYVVAKEYAEQLIAPVEPSIYKTHKRGILRNAEGAEYGTQRVGAK